MAAPEPSASEVTESEVESTPEPEAEPETAGGWYARGIELGTAGDFQAAAEAFLRSYDLQPTPEALFNAGLAYQNAGKTIAAIETYRRFLAEPERDSELASAAERAIVQLLREVGTLKGLRYEPGRPPVELYVNGELYEIDDLPITLNPGPVVIEVVDEAGEHGKETYEITAGEALVIDLRALFPSKPPPVISPSTNSTGPSPELLEAMRIRKLRVARLRTTAWVGMGMTGVAAISFATVAGLAAHERVLYLDQTCLDTGDCPADFTPGDPEAHLQAYTRLKTGAIISGSLMGGLALGSLVAVLVSRRLDRKPVRVEAGRDRDARRVRLVPSIGGFTIAF